MSGHTFSLPDDYRIRRVRVVNGVDAGVEVTAHFKEGGVLEIAVRAKPAAAPADPAAEKPPGHDWGPDPVDRHGRRCRACGKSCCDGLAFACAGPPDRGPASGASATPPADEPHAVNFREFL